MTATDWVLVAFAAASLVQAGAWLAMFRVDGVRFRRLLARINELDVGGLVEDGVRPCPGCHGDGFMVCLGEESCMNPLNCDGKRHECPVCDGVGREYWDVDDDEY